MKHGCAVVLAATVIAGLGLPPTAVEAGCNVRNPTACTADSRHPTEAPQPQAQPSQPQTGAATKPLQLKGYSKLGPARRKVSRSGKRRSVRRSSYRKVSPGSERETVGISPEATPKVSAAASTEANTAPLTPKAITTVSISARALVLARAREDRTVGFAAETAPWSGENTFTSANAAETSLPGTDVARSDEINSIDRAAGVANAVKPVTKSDSLIGASLTQSATPKPQASWLSRLYDKAVNGVFAAMWAIRSLFA
jgi:hypothetical protein